jgi:hypothetical protein
MSEKTVPITEDLVDEFLDVFDEVCEGEACRIAKSQILATLGLAEIGDIDPITVLNLSNWRNQVLEYRKKPSSNVKAFVFSQTVGMLNRCFKRENSGWLFFKLQKRWKKTQEKEGKT